MIGNNKGKYFRIDDGGSPRFLFAGEDHDVTGKIKTEFTSLEKKYTEWEIIPVKNYY